MKSILVVMALVMTSFAAQATLTLRQADSCSQIQVEKEALAYMNAVIQEGNEYFIGEVSCLEKAISEKVMQDFARGKRTQINTLTRQQIVAEILRDFEMQREAAQIKAEMFEKSFYQYDEITEAELDAEADLKRQNPLLDENGDIRE